MNRRELLKLATVALAGVRSARPGEYPGLPSLLVETVGRAANWKPVFLTSAQNETVMALTERIIPRTDTPGANDAQVHRYMDLFLATGEASDRDAFVKGLAALDKTAVKQYQAAFAKCQVEQQNAILADLAKQEAGDHGTSEGNFFQMAKQFTAAIYFNTPQGYKELNRYGVPGTYAPACPA